MEVVWEDDTTARLLFGIMTALDMPDAHMESLLTFYIGACLDNVQLNPIARKVSSDSRPAQEEQKTTKDFGPQRFYTPRL